MRAEGLDMRSEQSELRRQTCKACHCQDKFNYHVPYLLWEEVVPEGLKESAVCLDCFDAFACEKGVRYADALDTVYFAGEKASIELKVVDSHDP